MERRAVERSKAELAVRCRVRDEVEHALTYDISTDGCMLQTSNGFCAAGDAVELGFGALTLRGRVVWAKHRNAGVQFAGRTSSATIASIMSADKFHASTLASKAQAATTRFASASYVGLVIYSLCLIVAR